MQKHATMLTSKVCKNIIIVRFGRRDRHSWQICATHAPVTNKTTINTLKLDGRSEQKEHSRNVHRGTIYSLSDTDKVRGKGNWRMVKMILTPLVRAHLVIYSGKLKHVNRLVDTFTGRSGIVDRLSVSPSSVLGIVIAFID